MNDSENYLPLAGAEDRLRERDVPDWKIYGYRVLEKLSERSNGERITYLATEINSDRAVVIKQWSMPDFELSGDYERYLPEIRRLQQLDYLNIPPYLNSFGTSTGFCLVRGYQSGVSLAELKTLPPSDIKLVADAVLQILVDLQQLNPIVIHQNIKPENIIVNTEDRLMVYLVDFGLSAPGSSHPIAGTPGFIPPEQIFNRKLTAGSDIYSLGVSLICLLTGTPSSAAQNLLDDRCRPRFHHLLPEHTPTHLIALLEKMVEPNEQQRYPNAASALDPLNMSFKQPEPTTIEAIATTRKIRWWRWGILAGVGLGIGLLLRQFVFTDPDELSPEQLAKNQQIAERASFAASDRGRLIGENRCIGCNLNNQNFAKAELTGAVLSQSSLTSANFANANLRLAIFHDADLSAADLSRANLQQAALYGAKLLGTNLTGANLSKSKLTYAKLKGASLQNANLSNADLHFAELQQVNLSAANLTGANLSNADLSGADLRRAILVGAKLNGTNLAGATMPDGSIHP